jgi:AAA15 family ATPase/GTPase
MRIEKIIAKNYRQFKEIEILLNKKPDNDLHIAIGRNGTGKTNILNAINWCLYGDEPHLSRDSQQLPFLNLKSIEEAGFREPRIAWDWGYEQYPEVEKQIQVLEDAGYHRKDIYIFMIYNWNLDFEEMENKRIKCHEWKVQISDCRNRPLTQLHDYYKPLKDQNEGTEYHINPNWTDAEVKQFRKNVRRTNICVRHDFPYHSKLLENKGNFTKEEVLFLKSLPPEEALRYLPDLWVPSKITHPNDRDKWSSEREKVIAEPVIIDAISSTLHKIPLLQVQ